MTTIYCGATANRKWNENEDLWHNFIVSDKNISYTGTVGFQAWQTKLQEIICDD
jgi:hypothetical protein